MNNVFKSISKWHRRNKTIAELSRLDDRALNDIGMVRGNIASTVRNLR